MKFLWLLVMVLSIKCSASCMNVCRNIKEEPYHDDPGEPLILTPLIRQNKINLARKLSKVHLDQLPNVTSYSGYLTVNEEFNSNLFFWYFPCENKRYNHAPVVLWLQGGPGATSMIGLFTENGPLWIDKNSTLQFRTWGSWAFDDYSVIYIDNPVGTGYSFTDEGGYAQNQTIIGNQLYVALLQFFQLFPELQELRFFVAGESYAGKYALAVSHAIHHNNPTAKHKINLQGIMIASGFVDPVHQINSSNYYYQVGLIDIKTKKLMQQQEETVVQLIKQNKYLEAYQAYRNLMIGEWSLFTYVTGISNLFNYLFSDDPISDDRERMGKFIQGSNIRSKIHVGNAKFHSGDKVANYLVGDMMKSVTPWLSELLDYYPVLIYNGQLDIITPYTSTVNFIENLQFSGADVYKTTEREGWMIGSELCGYSKVAGNLAEAVVLYAGHMASYDQPNITLNLISYFISGSLTTDHTFSKYNNK